MGVNSLPKTVTRQRRGCDLNPDPSAPESSTLTTRLPSHPTKTAYNKRVASKIEVADWQLTGGCSIHPDIARRVEYAS